MRSYITNYPCWVKKSYFLPAAENSRIKVYGWTFSPSNPQNFIKILIWYTYSCILLFVLIFNVSTFGSYGKWLNGVFTVSHIDAYTHTFTHR